MKTLNIIEEIYAFDADEDTEEKLIESIQCDLAQTQIAKVGDLGITKIVLYKESGQMSYVPWAAIYKGDFLW